MLKFFFFWECNLGVPVWKCDQRVLKCMQCSFWGWNMGCCWIWEDNVHHSPEGRSTSNENAEEKRLVAHPLCLLCTLIPLPQSYHQVKYALVHSCATKNKVIRVLNHTKTIETICSSSRFISLKSIFCNIVWCLQQIYFLPGKIDNSGELTEKEIIRAERNSGVISNKVREIQVSESLFQLPI